jgi:hypothetical protein
VEKLSSVVKLCVSGFIAPWVEPLRGPVLPTKLKNDIQPWQEQGRRIYEHVH